MFSRQLFIFVLTVLVILYSTNNPTGRGTPQGFLICGNMNRYNLSTHNCVNRTVVPVSTPDTFKLTCGDSASLQIYDKRTHKCRNKKIVALFEAMPCGLKKKDTRHGFRCCGYRSYNPDFQTCCRSDHGLKFKIYDHKPEKKHVCCNMRAYRRSSPRAACHSSAGNDRLFESKTIAKVDQKLCREDSFVYLIEVKGRRRRYLNIKFSVWKWTPSKSGRLLRKEPIIAKNMRLKLDKYSPNKDLTGKMFLVFGKRFYADDKMFLLRYGDQIYRFKPNERKQRELLTRIRRRCKKFEIRQR